MRRFTRTTRFGPALASALALSLVLVLTLALPGLVNGQAAPTESTYRVEFYRVFPETETEPETGEGTGDGTDGGTGTTSGEEEKEPKTKKPELLTTQQQQNYANLARCQCGEKLQVRIQAPGGQSSIANDITDMRVGQACDQAMNVGSPYPRCVRLVRETSPRLNFVDFKTQFEINWLAHGLLNGNIEDLEGSPKPMPDQFCQSPGGSSGIWMCFGNDACTTGNFFMTPQSKSNSTDDSSGTSGGMGNGQSLNRNSVVFDFAPPAFEPVIVEALSGDRAVELRWKTNLSDDTYGYRVLCADEAGNAIDHPKIPSTKVRESIDGSLYFTKNNLCPEDDEEVDDDETGTTGDGTTGDGTTGDGTTGDGTTGDATTAGTGDDSTTSETTTATTESTASDKGSTSDSTGTNTNTTSNEARGSTATTTDTDASTSGLDDSGLTGTATDTTTGSEDTESEPPVDPSNEQILTLDWKFVCSDHISATSDRIRIEGLDNEKNYKFVLVAYDRMGNPVHSKVKVGTPRETDTFADLCEREGNCGKLGFCSIDSQPQRGRNKITFFLIVVGVALVRGRNKFISRKR